MRKIFISIIFCITLLSRSLADEGMWLPLLLGQQVYDDMVKRGLKLTKDQLYHINKLSLKDAVIIFGNGCTGEIVSAQGLIFTNHHCGYGAIAAASTVQNNYLRDGFYARSKQEEIPSKALTVQFLLRIEDVTKKMDSAALGLAGAERSKKIQEMTDEMNIKYADRAQGIEARVLPFFKANQYLVFVYQRFRDIRLVGAPPEALGNYGGDTDNWEWPRHTADFSVFRVYMSKEGKPADYSADNIPLKPKNFLPVSLKGVKEGDYAMTYGYPGSTNRYETSYGVKLKTEIENPALVELRDMRLKYMFEQMKTDPAVNLKLASSYASIANYWKFFDGETKQLLKYHVFEQKQAEENRFSNWAKGKPEFENVLNDWAKAYDQWRPYAKHRMYMNEGILGCPLLAFASSLLSLESDMVKKGVDAPEVKKGLQDADTRRANFLKDESTASDQNILGGVLRMFYRNIDKQQHPIGFFEAIKNQHGDLKDDNSFARYAAAVFASTMILDDTKWKAFIAKPDAVTLQNDPAFSVASQFNKNFDSKFYPFRQRFVASNDENGRLYMKGIMKMDTVKARKMYPDANFTMRVSFGNVKSYRPRDAVVYDYVCSMKGVLEKYKPGDYEFDLPQKFLDLANKKDFGPYADKLRNDLVVTFITTTDITGGNSGSPVINATGELIGLVFDGNYEALSHKIAFDKDLNRTICVDIRYVLWCIDKLGGASNIITELKLVK